ncbi:isochorismate synthase [Subtercola sp. YIM 133946]|uniref:isochorismate synthase n=1 Tax=Subtercola sp. YIM 133946 TaxID=3118909 RepID=UPI002F947988
MTETARATPRLFVETRAVSDIRLLIPLLDARHPLLWIRKGQGMAGLGTALRLEFSGADRFTEACAAWRDVAAAATVDDPLASPGTGLIAFGTFAFSAKSAETSVLIVPETIIGKRNGIFWVTRVRVLADGEAAPARREVVPGGHPVPPATSFGPEYRITLLPGAATPDTYRAAVESAVGHINAGELEKVVLARDVVGHLPAESDLRRILLDLALGYPDCWTFAVDGLIGSSPETLVRVDHGTVTARVLAGTISRGRDAEADHDQAVALATSAKDLDEHRFAVASVMTALTPHSRTLIASEIPFTLKLPNLWHLASDVEGTLGDGSTSLDLIASLHPTAAVAGTPTPDALRLIDELEPFDRGRYAGPVGWVGADGDGEWAVALRCAQVDDDGTITAYAGAGIVSESNPEHEFLETRMKFRPIVEAFG